MLQRFKTAGRYSLAILAALVLTLAVGYFNPMMAQEATEPTAVQNIFLELFGQYYATHATFEAMTIAVALFINEKVVKDQSSLVKQIISWVTAILLAVIGYFMGVPIFVGSTIGATILYGLQIGLSSNGIFKFFKSAKESTKAGEAA